MDKSNERGPNFLKAKKRASIFSRNGWGHNGNPTAKQKTWKVKFEEIAERGFERTWSYVNPENWLVEWRGRMPLHVGQFKTI